MYNRLTLPCSAETGCSYSHVTASHISHFQLDIQYKRIYSISNSSLSFLLIIILLLLFIVRSHLTSKRQSVLYFPYSALFSRVKGHKGSPVLPRLLASIVGGSLLRRAHFESLRVAEAKHAATINQLKYRSRPCIMENIALRVWSQAKKALGCASCFIGSQPRPRAIFPIMHSRYFN